MSAFPPKADIDRRHGNVRFVRFVRFVRLRSMQLRDVFAPAL